MLVRFIYRNKTSVIAGLLAVTGGGSDTINWDVVGEVTRVPTILISKIENAHGQEFRD